MISPSKQAPDEATDAGRAVDFQEVKHESDVLIFVLLS